MSATFNRKILLESIKAAASAKQIYPDVSQSLSSVFWITLRQLNAMVIKQSRFNWKLNN